MANVDLKHSISDAEKSRCKVKKTKKRQESSDHVPKITITDIEPTASENDKGYVYTCVIFHSRNMYIVPLSLIR